MEGHCLCSVLGLVTLAVIQHQTKATCGGKGFFSSYFHITVHHRRKSEQKLQQSRNLEAGADAEATEECCLLACSPMACSTCFIIKLGTTSPGVAPPTMGWALPHQSLIKKMPHRLAYSPILWRCFLSWASFLLDGSSLCQVDIKLPSTIDPLVTWHTITFKPQTFLYYASTTAHVKNINNF